MSEAKVVFERKIQKATPEGGYRVALPSELVEALKLKAGDSVKIFLEKGRIIIEKGEKDE